MTAAGIVSVAIVIPALNAATVLPATLAALKAGSPRLSVETIVVDGSSTDATVECARANGARTIAAPRGRGTQLAAGAAATESQWLLFMHADTRLDSGWADAILAHLARSDAARQAAYFRFALDDASPAARRIERLAGWRARVLALPYGDQGLFLSRSLYDAVGGYRPLVLMEDVDLVRRLGRHRLVGLEARAVTSADRYRRDGFWLRPLRNLFYLGLFVAGVPPRLIARLYG
ncbi:MAG: TIGR04283 family arsenosugar biosynthesis glycosyltransferase [Alphaproteobacteria bacterium]